MYLLALLACAGLSGDAASDTSHPDRSGETGEAARGSVVRIVTKDVDVSGEAEVTVQTPDNGTFLRVDACYDGEEIVCENFAGSYTLSPDGSIRISPSAWDGSIARVTWIVIE